MHRWCGCPLAMVIAEGAISTQMHLIASTLSWLAADLWNDQMLCPGPGALTGAWGQVDAASGNENCQGRPWVSSCVLSSFFFAHLVDQFLTLVLCLHCWCGSIVAWSNQHLSLSRLMYVFFPPANSTLSKSVLSPPFLFLTLTCLFHLAPPYLFNYFTLPNFEISL